MISAPRQRIDLPANDAAKFHHRRDKWRDVAAGCKLPKAAHRVASLLHGYVSRDYGYAFPTDEQLAVTMNTSTRNVGKGMAALDYAGLIDRQTIVKRDEKGEAIGRLRRIYLTLPKDAGDVDTTPEVNGTPPEVNGTPPEVNGTNQVSERINGVRITPDRITPDKSEGTERSKLGVYACARDSLPPVFGSDVEFLDAFDHALIGRTEGKDIGAGELERITREAFDQATDSDDLFMPFHWAEVCALRDPMVAEWFRARTGTIVHRRAA